MAWLELDPDSNCYKVCFRFGGRRFKKSLKTDDRAEAEILLGGVVLVQPELEIRPVRVSD